MSELEKLRQAVKDLSDVIDRRGFYDPLTTGTYDKKTERKIKKEQVGVDRVALQSTLADYAVLMNRPRNVHPTVDWGLVASLSAVLKEGVE